MTAGGWKFDCESNDLNFIVTSDVFLRHFPPLPLTFPTPSQRKRALSSALTLKRQDADHKLPLRTCRGKLFKDEKHAGQTTPRRQ